MKKLFFKIEGMTCDSCAETIRKSLQQTERIEADVSYPEARASVTTRDEKITSSLLIGIIENAGPYRVTEFSEIEADTKDRKHLVIIGGGSAAFAGALRALELGARVTMINDGLPIGGTCVNVGCVPSKTLLRAADTLQRANRNPFGGIETQGKLSDFRTLIGEKRHLVESLRLEKYIGVIKDKADFQLIEGRARLQSPTGVSVNGTSLRADHILLATGARPNIPAVPGLDQVPYLTNASAFELDSLPESMIVLGGRYIALELAQLFARLGTRVTLVQRSGHILPDEDTDLTDRLVRYLTDEGIEILTDTQLQTVDSEGGRVKVKLLHKGRPLTVTAEKILAATGRKPNTENIGLKEAGVSLNQDGSILTDDLLRTTAPTISAAGDVLGKRMFVYTAAYEGKLAVENAFSEVSTKTDYTALPWVVFTDPQLAGVGLNEREAGQAGRDIETARLELDKIPRAIAARDTRGFIKLIREKGTHKLLGARILAPEGAEILMEITLAIKFGMTSDQLTELFHPYLTLSEGIRLAAITFDKDVSELSCCAT
ncbi:MAG: mercury(II) reductase [FCB group bacterium]|nr:mercury(II) reductase [FCB group bacterium]